MIRLLLGVLLLVIPVEAWTCQTFVAKSEIPLKIGKVPHGGSAHCGGADPCVCIDGIDWDTAAWDGNLLSTDPVKQAAKDAAIAAAANDLATRETKRSARLALLRQCVVDLAGGATAAQVKQCALLVIKHQIESALSTGEL